MISSCSYARRSSAVLLRWRLPSYLPVLNSLEPGIMLQDGGLSTAEKANGIVLAITSLLAFLCAFNADTLSLSIRGYKMYLSVTAPEPPEAPNNFHSMRNSAAYPNDPISSSIDLRHSARSA